MKMLPQIACNQVLDFRKGKLDLYLLLKRTPATLAPVMKMKKGVHNYGESNIQVPCSVGQGSPPATSNLHNRDSRCCHPIPTSSLSMLCTLA